MAQFNILASGGNAPYTISVKKVGDNTERYISGGTTGTGLVVFTHDIGTYIYNVIVSKAGCTQAISGFTLTCNVPTSPVTPCVGITNLNIVGLSSVQANSTGQYTISYTGDKPLNYTWQISGQGTQIISGGNADTVNFKFGSSSNFYLYLSITDKCGRIVLASKELILIPVVVCDIVIDSISTQCLSTTSSRTIVSASSASNKNLKYGILGLVDYRTSNIFDLGNSDSSGYTFIVAEVGNESCNKRVNKIINCTVPAAPTSPAVCDIVISELRVECTSTASSKITVIASSRLGRTLQYGIQGFKDYQPSNIFELGNSDAAGYTFIVSEVGNTSCNAINNRVINCSNPIPPTSNPPITPITPISSCDITINSVAIQCNGYNNSTVAVNATSISGKTIKYGILGIKDYQISNTFTLVNSDLNGYTFIAAETNNEVCNARTNRVIGCNATPNATPNTPPISPVSPNHVPSPVAPSPIASTTGCYMNVNFTITDDNYGTTAAQDNTAVTFERCGQQGTTDYIVNSLGLIVPFYHNQNYTLPICITAGSIQTLGGWTATINSTSSCSVVPTPVTVPTPVASPVVTPIATTIILNQCDVIFNLKNGGIYKYDIITSELTKLAALYPSTDVAMTDTKLWINGIGIVHEYNITKNPYSLVASRDITFPADKSGNGLAVLNNTTLVIGGTELTSLDISANVAVATTLFTLPFNTKVSGDFIYRNSTNTYIVTYFNITSGVSYVGEFSLTGTVLKQAVISISAAYGIIQVGSNIYIVSEGGGLYLLNQTDFSITINKVIGANIPYFFIAGATQSPQCT